MGGHLARKPAEASDNDMDMNDQVCCASKSAIRKMSDVNGALSQRHAQRCLVLSACRVKSFTFSKYKFYISAKDWMELRSNQL